MVVCKRLVVENMGLMLPRTEGKRKDNVGLDKMSGDGF
jgi:hypothetical protein